MQSVPPGIDVDLADPLAVEHRGEAHGVRGARGERGVRHADIVVVA
jgi:hypothetical protein